MYEGFLIHDKICRSYEKSAITVAGNMIATYGARVWAITVSQRGFHKSEIKKKQLVENSR